MTQSGDGAREQGRFYAFQKNNSVPVAFIRADFTVCLYPVPGYGFIWMDMDLYGWMDVGEEQMYLGCGRGHLDWIFGRISSLKGWTSIGAGCPGKQGATGPGSAQNPADVVPRDTLWGWTRQCWVNVLMF